MISAPPSASRPHEATFDENRLSPAVDTIRSANILYLANSEQIGGGNRSLLTLADGLRQLGHRPMVMTPRPGPMSAACRDAGLPCTSWEYIQPTWRQPVTTWRGYRDLQRWLGRNEIELIHANDPGNARAVSLAAWRRGIPVVCHIRFLCEPGSLRWMFRGLPKPDLFVFNSRALQASAGPHLRRSSPRSEQAVVYNAVCLDQFFPRPVVTGERFRVGIVANLLPVKGHADFLEMAAELSRRQVDAEYWLIGEDIHRTGYRQKLEALVDRLGLQSRVRFLGTCDEVGELINRLDVVVCSSHVEPFGRCLIEAMACKKPVVATRVGGIPEVVCDGETGLLVPPQAPVELAEAVQQLLADPQRRQSMGQAGYERVRRLFSQQAHLDQMVTLYRRLLGRDDWH